MTPLALVCFDLGGVVVRIQRSWADAVRAAGLALRDGFRADSPVVAELVRRYQSGLVDTRGFARELSVLSCEQYSPDEIVRVHDAWLIGEYDGMAALMMELRDDGLQLAVLSNTNEAHWPRMLTWPALAPVQHLLASHLIGAVKPEERAYRAVEAASGVGGEAILFFDDTEENVAGARAAGWRAELIDPAGIPVEQVRGVIASIARRPYG
ncbi:MAG: HAD-IA family hydrolase [Myxococcota bacterium]